MRRIGRTYKGKEKVENEPKKKKLKNIAGQSKVGREGGASNV